MSCSSTTATTMSVTTIYEALSAPGPPPGCKVRKKRNKRAGGRQPLPVTSEELPVVGADSVMLAIPLGGYCLSVPVGRRRIALSRFTDGHLYQLLRAYVMMPNEQAACGYPSPVGNGRVYLPARGAQPLTSDPLVRVCCRCGEEFRVRDSGEYETQTTCKYHWGKVRSSDGGADDCYSCCSGRHGAPGCSVGILHVSDGFERGGTVVSDFVKTRPTWYGPFDGNYGVCAIDCEMVYTTHGLELGRVTLVLMDGLVLYDTYVKPEHAIVDYNTQFSGLTAKNLDGVTKTVQDVQNDLLNLLNADTILVGHGLENDLRVLRLLHATVIDTAVLFPHHYGLPYRRSLRSLVASYLHKDIQNNGAGHDSYEDARACMELVLWKLQKDVFVLRKTLHV